MPRRRVPTAFPHCSHIVTKRASLHYRRRLPSRYGAGEFTLALRTTDYREASHRALMLDRAFARVLQRNPRVRMIDLKAILREQLAQSLQADLDQHLEARAGKSVYGITAEWDDERDAVDHDLEIIETLIDDAAERLQRRDIAHVRERAVELAGRYDVPESRHVELAIGLLQVELQTLHAARERVLGGAVGSISLDVPSSSSGDAPTPTGTHDAPVPSAMSVAEAGPLLSAAWPPYVALKKKGDKPWRKQTERQNDATFRMFLAHCGDRRVNAYGRTDLAGFFTLLGSLPSLYAKVPRYRGMTLAEIAAAPRRDGEKMITTKTIKRHKTALSAFFAYLIDMGYCKEGNPATGHRVSIQAAASQERKHWEGDKLRKLFASPLFKGAKSARSRAKPGRLIIKDAKYWLPILGLYQGARLEEMAQLLRGDLRQQDGIHYMDINNEGDKQIKNEQSRRCVPLHPTVLQLGFLDYVARVTSSESDPVFPELRPGGADGKKSDAFTRWFPRYRQQVGVYEEGLVFHSFRNTLTRKLYDLRVDEVVIDELTGHKGGSMSRHYKGRGLELRWLYEALSRVEYPEIDWGALG